MAGIGFFHNNNRALLKNAAKINKLDNQYKKNKKILLETESPEEFEHLQEACRQICNDMRKLSEEINLFIGIDASEKMMQELDEIETVWNSAMQDHGAESGA